MYCLRSFFSKTCHHKESGGIIRILSAYIGTLFLIVSHVCANGENINHSRVDHDLVWTSINGDFFNGAFIGDGVQGAMIMQDTLDKNAIRMLMGHYKAVAHNYIKNLDMCNSRVYAGNIIISPKGIASSQTMRLNIMDGEANGTITTDKGTIQWSAIAERKHNVILVIMKGDKEETAAGLNVREEWGITPAIYYNNKSPDDFAAEMPPKPVKTSQGAIDLVVNRMKKRGAHIVASQLVTGTDNTRILYVAIGVDDNINIDSAVNKATNNAIARVQAAVLEGATAISNRHKAWWRAYMQKSSLAISEDAYWEKFWWIQQYKFACASSETADFLIDTQGPWIWKCGWAAIWWNLNVQLSYFPMYSSNKLDVGRSLIKGMDRIYTSGAFRKNAGTSPGTTVGRSTCYDGSGTWGDEFGNLSWILHNYWKYWRYSGDDAIGRSLFPMLKDNASFLLSKLEKDAQGKYHMKPSRSPEYSDDSLYYDANYALMSLHWVLTTLLSMNKELGFNDPQQSDWQEHLDNLTPFPTDQNGLRIGSTQGFDKGHRHYSHLLAIYPYHTLTPSQGNVQKDLILRSINRWLSFSSGYAGYSYTGGCAMYAILGDGEKAVSTLDRLKLTPNTLYKEAGAHVIETPLSGVESINYMLLQSWDNIIRVFPAVPARWKNLNFNNFRTEGAFLVSASLCNGTIGSTVVITSEKGKKCSIVNPWKGKNLFVVDNQNNAVNTTQAGDIYSFTTKAGTTYTLSANPTHVYDTYLVSGQQKIHAITVHRSTIIITPYESGSIDIRIFNLLGQELIHIENHRPENAKNAWKIPMSRFGKGFYFVEINTDNGNIHRNVLIQ